jgi:hypothetical protein
MLVARSLREGQAIGRKERPAYFEDFKIWATHICDVWLVFGRLVVVKLAGCVQQGLQKLICRYQKSSDRVCTFGRPRPPYQA